jgi:hypothetical protein
MLTESSSRQAPSGKISLAMFFIAGLSLAGALCGMAAPVLAGDPPKGVFLYTISREGEPVGQQRMEFIDDQAKLRVISHTSLEVKMLGLSLFAFDQQVEELRQGGNIISLTSIANDDGSNRKVSMTLQGGRLKGIYNSNSQRDADPKLGTSLFWQEPPLGKAEVIDCLRGKVRDVTVTDLGAETVNLAIGRIEAHHLRVAGGLQRELWYDADGILVAGELKAKDGTTVRQELLQRP